MLPIRTERLVVRLFGKSDVDALTQYRNDPQIARYQAWDVPYSRTGALEIAAEQVGRDKPVEGRWTTLAVEHDGEVIGDVATYLRAGGGVAEIGYTLARAHHGNGFATEAAGAVADALFEHAGVHRIEATLDVDHVASMRVLEAIGMQFECIANSAFFWRGNWVDDLRYAMTATDRRGWLTRSVRRPERVELVELEPDTAYLWGRLRTHRSQERFVAPMALSFRDALFPDLIDGGTVAPWMRGVLADGERVGFVMCADVTPTNPDAYLWRLLVDRTHQRRGIGTLAVAAVADHFRDRSTRLLTSYAHGPGSPESFYRGLGFVPTGEIGDGETVAALPLVSQGR